MHTMFAADMASTARRSSRSPFKFDSLLRLKILVLALGIAVGETSVVAFGDDKTRQSMPPDQPVSFNQDVRPILSNHCFLCHGPDENDRRAGLRLDVAEDIDFDAIVERITTDDPDLMMPPPSLKKPLSDSQVAVLKRWIDEGAEYEEHWSFLPIASPEVPTNAGPINDSPSQVRNAIDRFVLAELQSRPLKVTPEADKRTLIRRLSLDLTGLPPTRQQIEDFIHDGDSHAYEKLVDRLLESQHYGEHMARYWLDLVRFADTNGLHHDHYREMTPYRDWVIRAFNENLPFDDFATAQIAGDLLPDPTTDQLIASGFNRLHLIIDRGTALPEESFTRNVVDRVSAVGTAFLGLTLECAVCHDHKYDPVSQKDFYQFYAFFNNFDGAPETGGRRGLDFKRGLQPPYLELPNESQKQQLGKLNAEIASLEKQLAASAKRLTSSPDDSELQQNHDDLEKQLGVVRQRYEAVVMNVPATLIMKERSEIRPAHVLVRGNYDQPGELVQRNTPSFLPPMTSAGQTPTRLDLARWMVAPEHPLTARVTVNRFWQQLFGVGLVKTSEDFGAQGEPPSHPELLDYLASQFIHSGWDVKQLMRLMVTSQTYRRSAVAPSSDFRDDPANRFLARGSRYRYDGEVIRDQLLFSTGLLNLDLYGKSVKPPQPDGLWKIVAMPNSYPKTFVADEGDAIYRRSVYTFWKRALPPPQMTIFDAPTREACIARRERTNTPLQALVLMNEQQYFAAAMHLAKQLIEDPSLATHDRLTVAYERITSKLPRSGVDTRLAEAHADFLKRFEDEPERAAEMLQACFDAVIVETISSSQQAEIAALGMTIHAILNLDQTRTRE
ncbi:PSD1 and planctomycete cytochrome C domain-containing protein [Roseiconus lacunae]|uniref:PSD1 and planctomycete cytochrome C domain-containing protein n=1 Tax=Roseiconus lacunae TaxID=2605694 RepID=A0ABT7PEM1_9BACT|nr:PSD1 and planctomycete cytochrome C domain-containing protein [Roseiconus lacunae]MDM4014798.1 PSD1 and planctomycete cytochrome C domain-containing protein [Roseiconus lacunae]